MINSMVAQRIDGIYRNFISEIITSEIAIANIIRLLEALNYASEKEIDRNLINVLIKKGVRLVLRIDKNSKQIPKFLQKSIKNNTIDLSVRYKVFSILERNFPRKVKGLGEYLLSIGSGYFPDNIKFDNGDTIIKFGLSDFLFRVFKILSKYDSWVFNKNYFGFVTDNCLIVNVSYDDYKFKEYNTKFLYSQREKWKITGYGKSMYIIDDNHNIGLKELLFAVNLYKKYIPNFDDDKLSIQYSNDIDIPVRLEYEKSDIRIYFFESPLNHDIKQAEENKEIKRSEVIDIIDTKWFKN